MRARRSIVRLADLHVKEHLLFGSVLAMFELTATEVMPLEITLVIDDGGEIRLLDVTGFSVESNERIVDELEVVINGATEALAICGVALHLYQEYPSTSWSMLIRYADGRSDGRLIYTAPGGVPEEEQVPVPKWPTRPIDRVSRYARKPVI